MLFFPYKSLRCFVKLFRNGGKNSPENSLIHLIHSIQDFFTDSQLSSIMLHLGSSQMFSANHEKVFIFPPHSTSPPNYYSVFSVIPETSHSFVSNFSQCGSRSGRLHLLPELLALFVPVATLRLNEPCPEGVCLPHLQRGNGHGFSAHRNFWRQRWELT